MLFAIENIGFGGLVKPFRHEDGFDEVLNFLDFRNESSEILLGIVSRFLFEERDDLLADAGGVFLVSFGSSTECFFDSVDDLVRIERSRASASSSHGFDGYCFRFLSVFHTVFG